MFSVWFKVDFDVNFCLDIWILFIVMLWFIKKLFICVVVWVVMSVSEFEIKRFVMIRVYINVVVIWMWLNVNFLIRIMLCLVDCIRKLIKLFSVLVMEGLRLRFFFFCLFCVFDFFVLVLGVCCFDLDLCFFFFWLCEFSDCMMCF